MFTLDGVGKGTQDQEGKSDSDTYSKNVFEDFTSPYWVCEVPTQSRKPSSTTFQLLVFMVYVQFCLVKSFATIIFLRLKIGFRPHCEIYFISGLHLDGSIFLYLLIYDIELFRNTEIICAYLVNTLARTQCIVFELHIIFIQHGRLFIIFITFVE